MTSINQSNGKLTVTAYAGDAKTLLAFNLDEASSKNLAGFTVAYSFKGKAPNYLYNNLQFEDPAKHVQDPKEPPYSTINAPLHKFRWLHVPGSVNQGLSPFMGKYTYTVTPRYFNEKQTLLPIDPGLGVSVTIDVVPFAKGNLRLGFTRGFVQSQAFVHHFGDQAHIQPAGRGLTFDTSQLAGVNSKGEKYTYADEYGWLGFTARQQIFELLNEVLQNNSLHLDMFAYDLNEPDFIKILLQLAAQGRVRVILDNAALHHNKDKNQPEDEFEKEFIDKQTGIAAITRGKFARYAHDKVLIVSDAHGPIKVLTGSTNFAVTGFYVNSNHVLVFNEPEVAGIYSQVFEESWKDKVKASAFSSSPLAQQPFIAKASTIPPLTITFSPHDKVYADQILSDLAARVNAEANKPGGGSVLFAVMQMDNSESTVYKTLKDIHQNESVLSFGISDAPGGIILHEPSRKTGLLVSGKPGKVILPAPFDQVPSLGGGHQVHHKFVVCGFNRPDAVVYCGSSNLANGGEAANGDNLLVIKDSDVATVFAIEAIALVDHFQFLDRCARGGSSTADRTPEALDTQLEASKVNAAVLAHWYLSTSDFWVKKYYDPQDLYYADRMLFGHA